MNKKNKDQNYLELIPIKNPAYEWSMDENQHITIHRPNQKWMEKITQKILHTPKVTHIELEEFGDFIWPLLDGKNTVFDIAVQVDQHFGENAAPLYDRLIKYLENMKYHKLILIK